MKNLARIIIHLRKHIGRFMFYWFAVMFMLEIPLLLAHPTEAQSVLDATGILGVICFSGWLAMVVLFLPVLVVIENFFPEGWSKPRPRASGSY